MTRVHQEEAISIGIKLTAMDCAECGVVFAVASGFCKERRTDGKSFYCPNGHSLSYTESEAAKLRKKAETLEKENDDLYKRYDTERKAKIVARRQTAAAKGQITKLRKRAEAGLCPVCNRHFTALERHMHTKHPDCTIDGE